TLIDVLDWQVEANPDRQHVLFYRTPEQTEPMTYRELKTAAIAIAAGLKVHGLEPGQSVAIMLPTCLEFFHCFFGILMAGGVPVPLYPPARLSQLEDHLRRQAGILESCLAPILITVPEAKLVGRFLEAQVDSLDAVVTVRDLCKEGGEFRPQALRAGDVAFLQYTSGSTGNPKGVVLTHANLLANLRAWGRAVRLESTDVVVSWLPLYHDMGLIGTWLGSLYHSCPLVLMSPLDFLARPERWLQAIHRHRGTATAAPNFAYELCLRHLGDAELQGLDLSSWRVAANGAEPVSPDTIARFAERFGHFGFRPETMMPVYGLAECTVGLAIPPLGRKPIVDRVQREPFIDLGQALPAAESDADALRFVACGMALPDHQIRITDPSGRELPDRIVGRLEFRGPSATSGYFRNPEETRRLFRGEWLDSGDLAYMVQGDIYLTSRAKDMIIRGGRNIYPYELEEAVGGLRGIRKGCVAIFGVSDAAAGTERLVIVAETRERDRQVLDGLQRSIASLAVDLVGAPPEEIVLAPPQTVLKTSSGKIRRAATRERYLAGTIGAATRAPWLQLVRVAWKGMSPLLRRLGRRVAERAHAARAWAAFCALAPLGWLTVVLLPRPAWAWTASRFFARTLLRLAGVPILVEGLEQLPGDAPIVVVANHASYLDGIVLAAALPRAMAFIAKRELRDAFIARLFLGRLGARFVERFDVERSVEESGRLSLIARGGESLLFFAEGTFTRAPGLMPFRTGAFQVAAEAGIAVVPVTITGTRAVLRDGSLFPRRGRVSVVISPPIAPSGKGWSAAVRLRDAARAEILRLCGEPDLAR
ncbi:MAG: AMP-binding protein, partial [Burkholderiales bacterium]